MTKAERDTEDRQIAAILHRLRSREAQQAWSEFLELYSAVILQVVHLFERDADHAADCFLFVCEQLSRKQFRRLRRFRVGGPASFATWLRAVVRNLCLDWHRKEFGRQRIFKSIANLSELDREVFRRLYEERLPLDATPLTLRARFPHLTEAQLAESCERVRQSLTPRQFWLLSTRRPRIEQIASDTADLDIVPQEIPDSGPTPEALTAWNEMQAALARALAGLPKPERLLIRLRFEQGLTLEEIARTAELGDAQRADRRIKEILERLRRDMS